jgi:hypothetical protein
MLLHENVFIEDDKRMLARSARAERAARIAMILARIDPKS